MLSVELSCEMWQIGEDAEHLGRPSYCPIALYMLSKIICRSPEGGGLRSLGLMTYTSVEGSGP
jgi:hypothetical protein